MAKAKDGSTYLYVGCPPGFMERVRAHADKSAEPIAAFARRMIEKGVLAAIEDGTLYEGASERRKAKRKRARSAK